MKNLKETKDPEANIPTALLWESIWPKVTGDRKELAISMLFERFSWESDDSPEDLLYLSGLVSSQAAKNILEVLIERRSLINAFALEEEKRGRLKLLVERLGPKEASELWPPTQGIWFPSNFPLLLVEQLDSLHAKNVCLKILEQLVEKPWVGPGLSESLPVCLRKLNKGDADEVLSIISKTMRKDRSVLGDGVPSDLVKEMVAILWELPDGEANDYPLRRRSRRVISFGSALPPEIAEVVINDYAESLKEGRNMWDHADFLKVLSVRGLSASSRRTAFELLLKFSEKLFFLSGDPDPLLDTAVTLIEGFASSDRGDVVATVVQKLEHTEDAIEIAFLVRLIGYLKDEIPGKIYSDAVDKLVGRMRLQAEPKCHLITDLIVLPKDSMALDLLKWPTCFGEDRDKVIKRIDDLLPSESFGSTDEVGTYHADLWKFAAWAEKEGLDVKNPPIPPRFEDLRVE